MMIPDIHLPTAALDEVQCDFGAKEWTLETERQDDVSDDRGLVQAVVVRMILSLKFMWMIARVIYLSFKLVSSFIVC